MKKTVSVILVIALLLVVAGIVYTVCVIRGQMLHGQPSDKQTGSNQPTETHFCGNQTTENQILDERIPQHLNTQRNKDPFSAFIALFNNTAASQKADTKLDIPLYYEDELLNKEGKAEFLFALNYDASRFPRHLSSVTNMAPVVLETYPTDALRIREDNSWYAVYDTETGCRFYLFFEAVEHDQDFSFPMGFPIMIKDMLCRMCFQNIKIGDPIEKVEAIDRVTTRYKESFQGIDPDGAKLNTEAGYPLASIHYLKDGILKINYTMQEDRSLVVSEIIFDETYQLTDSTGRAIDYKIADTDLPIN